MKLFIVEILNKVDLSGNRKLDKIIRDHLLYKIKLKSLKHGIIVMIRIEVSNNVNKAINIIRPNYN